MVKIDGKFYMDKKLKKELDWGIQCCQKEDDDFVIIVDGKEGAGKSKFVRQIGYYCGKVTGYGFGIDNIHFTADDYKNTAEDNRKKKAWVNILDESRSSLNKKRSLSRGNVRFTNWFSECRDMNHIHILVLPAMHDLDSYIGLWRLNLVLHVLKYRKSDEAQDSGYKMVRGTYLTYSPEEMQGYIHKQFRYGKYAYPSRERTQYQTFTDYEVLEDLEAYKQKKAEKRAAKEQDEEKESKYLEKIRIATYLLQGVCNMQQKQIAEYLDVPQPTASNWAMEGEKLVLKIK